MQYVYHHYFNEENIDEETGELYEGDMRNETIYPFKQMVLIKDMLDDYEQIDWFPVVISLTASIGIHYGLFEWDEVSIDEVMSIVKLWDLSGHIYKTLHGYHLYSDRLYTTQQYYAIAKAAGTCEQHRELGYKLGYWGLRCGLKENREPDIVYIGHTSGDDIPLSEICLEKDMLYQVMIDCKETIDMLNNNPGWQSTREGDCLSITNEDDKYW